MCTARAKLTAGAPLAPRRPALTGSQIGAPPIEGPANWRAGHLDEYAALSLGVCSPRPRVKSSHKLIRLMVKRLGGADCAPAPPQARPVRIVIDARRGQVHFYGARGARALVAPGLRAFVCL